MDAIIRHCLWRNKIWELEQQQVESAFTSSKAATKPPNGKLTVWIAWPHRGQTRGKKRKTDKEHWIQVCWIHCEQSQICVPVHQKNDSRNQFNAYTMLEVTSHFGPPKLFLPNSKLFRPHQFAIVCNWFPNAGSVHIWSVLQRPQYFLEEVWKVFTNYQRKKTTPFKGWYACLQAVSVIWKYSFHSPQSLFPRDHAEDALLHNWWPIICKTLKMTNRFLPSRVWNVCKTFLLNIGQGQ